MRACVCIYSTSDYPPIWEEPHVVCVWREAEPQLLPEKQRGQNFLLVTLQEDTIYPHAPPLLPNIFSRCVTSQHADVQGWFCLKEQKQLEKNLGSQVLKLQQRLQNVY